jgi:hypothetical protein
MSDAVQPQSLSEDIAFIRAMAEEGRRVPFRGGVSLTAGLIWGSASLYCWSVASGLWTNPPGGVASTGWIWLIAAVLFAIAGFPLRMYRRSPGAPRMAATAWGAVGIACWTISAAIIIAGARTHVWAIFAVIPPVIMALYAGGWMIGAMVFRARWQLWVGGLCLLSSLVLAWFAAQPVEFLLFALALYGLAGLPGLVTVLRPRPEA